ncbi:hypothetical protein C8J57DRAFT_1286498 [Mycena rebaudengoi]|nr:hypothetical protein C8J57DRAFT_1286498 [Mycena rebaudengoi]
MDTSASQEEQIAALLEAIKNVRVSNAAGVAVVALLMHDSGKSQLNKILVLFSRYYVVTRSNLSTNRTDPPSGSCVAYDWWTSVGGAMCFTTAVNIVLLMRVFALHNRSRRVLAILSFLVECYTSVQAAVAASPTVFLPPPGLPMPGCWFNPGKITFTVAAWASCLTIATIFFGMTAIKLFTPFHWDSQLSISQNLNFLKSVSPLLVTFATDGCIFFIMYAPSACLTTQTDMMLSRIFGRSSAFISTRLVLHLKHKAASTLNGSEAGDTTRSIEFQNMRSNLSRSRD